MSDYINDLTDNLLKAATGSGYTCFFYDPTDIGNLISGSSDFSKSSLNIWKSLIDVLLKPSLENFEQYFASLGEDSNGAVVCLSLGLE